MGHAFDDNGSYVGWSNLFDYTSLNTLKKSELLPVPTGEKIALIESKNAQNDINSYLNRIKVLLEYIVKRNAKPKEGLEIEPEIKVRTEEEDRLEILDNYLVIFNIIEKDKNVKPINKANREVLQSIYDHYSIKIPADMYSYALRNFISSHIQSSVQNIRNLKDSYIPVDMEDLRDAAELSPKGLDAKTITLLNPLSVFKMQRQNMIGKGVIGIAATGQKAAFMLSYFLNDVYKNAKEGVDYNIVNGNIEIIPNSPLAWALFAFRSEELIKNPDHVVTMLPSLNTEHVIPALVEYSSTHKLTPDNTIDIMISLLITAATDNAKELVLDKINAGNNLAKCFLFGIVLGCNVTDLVKFMTSPVISYINTLSLSFIYGRNEMNVNSAADLVEYYINNLLGEGAMNVKPDIKVLLDIIFKEADEPKLRKYLKDIKEFRNLLEGADEFSSLGRVLSINQGIPTLAEKLEMAANLIAKIVRDREKALKLINAEGVLTANFDKLDPKYKAIAGDKFDPIKWLQNKTITLNNGELVQYRTLTSEYYNLIKKGINVFAIMDYLPHFKEMYKLMGSVFTVHEFPVRTRIVLEAIRQYKELNDSPYLDDKSYSLILGAANELMLMKFFDETPIRFPIRKGDTLIDERGVPYSSMANSRINLATDHGRAAFKQVFEDQVIPDLKAGKYFKVGEKYDFAEVLKLNEMVASNPFIVSLIKGRDHDIPYWKTNINMSADNAYTQLQLSRMAKGLQELHNIRIGGYSLADWFAIYNFIVNKNQYGSDRLTKVFEVFLRDFNNGTKNIINDYFRFVGSMDYNTMNVKEVFNINVYDMLMQSARVVDDLNQAQSLMVIKDLKYYIKVGMNYYEPFEDVIDTDLFKDVNDLINSYLFRKSYFVLSSPYSAKLKRIKGLLNSRSPYKAFSMLMERGNVKFNYSCV